MRSLEIKNPILAGGFALGITSGLIGVGVGIDYLRGMMGLRPYGVSGRANYTGAPKTEPLVRGC